MVTKLTREQYNQIYGVQPPQPSVGEVVDTTPTTVKMTRAEYNATYRPPELSRFQETAQDVKGTGQAVAESVETGIERTGEIRQRERSGEISKAKGLFQTFGTGLGTVSNIIGDVLIGAGKVVLPEEEGLIVSEQGLRDFAGAMGEEFSEYNQQFITDLRNSEKETDRQIAAQIDEFIHLYKTDDVLRADIQAAGSIFEGLASALGFGPASRVTTRVKQSASDLAQEGSQTIKETADRIFTVSDQEAARKIADEIQSIEEKYVGGRKLNDFSRDGGVASRDRIARSGVLNGAVDEDGLIRTKQDGGAAQQYKELTIDGVEDIVKRTLIKEDKQVNLNEVRDYLKDEIFDSRLEGAALTKAINSVEREIEGLAKRADDFGNLLLAKIQDFKIAATEDINYLVDANASVRFKKAKASAYRKLIEDKSDAPIKSINAELSKYYEDIKRLEALDGRRVKGGRLGKYFSTMGGQVVGGFAGSAGGALGAGIGALAGGEVAEAIAGKAFKSKFGRTTPGERDVNPILERAKRYADEEINLKTPDKPVGLPDGVPDTPEARLLERKIKDNVKQQKAAIKAGDFELVATLKDVYRSLVTKLKNYIKDYIDNIDENIGVGLSIRASVNPEGVAKNIDAEDFNNILKFLDDPITEQLDPIIIRMLRDMGIGKADLDIQVRFLKEVTDEAERSGKLAEFQNRPDLNQNQVVANTTPNTTDIDSTVDEVVDDVNEVSPQSATTETTDLLEEARKYDSATDFSDAIAEQRGGIKLAERTELRNIWEEANPEKIKAKEERLADMAKRREERVVSSDVPDDTTMREYGMSHRPSQTGATADDISKGGEVIPEDFYQHPEWYADMSDKAYQESWQALQNVKGKPNAEITVYRASPKNELNEGDWITLSKEYAKRESLDEGVKVHSFKAKAKDIQFAGDDINEFGYWPTDKTTDLLEEARKYDSAEEFVEKATFYRGEGGSQGGGNYYTKSQPFAAEFAGIKPISEKQILETDIFRPSGDDLPFAGNEAEVTKAIAEAKKAGKKAVYLSEGSPFGEPIESVFVFDKTAIREVDELMEIWEKANQRT